MIDVVTVGAGGGSIAWISPEGTLKVGPQSAGADPGPLCYGSGGTEPTVTDAHVVLGRIPPHLLGGEIPLDVERGAGRPRDAGRAARPGLERARHRDPGDLGLEPGQRAAPGHGQARPRRPRLHAGDLRRLRLAAGLPAGRHPRARRRPRAAEPGQRVGVRAAHRRRPQRLRADRRRPRTRPRPRARASGVRRPHGAGRDRAGPRGVRPRRSSDHVRTADLRYSGQAFEVRVPVPRRAGRRGVGGRGGRAPSTTRTGSSTATTSATTRASRSSGSTSGSPGSARSAGPSCASCRRRDGGRTRAARASRRGVLRRLGRHPDVYWRPDLRAGDVVAGPAVIEEFGSTVPVHPGFAATVDAFGNLVVTEAQ